MGQDGRVAIALNGLRKHHVRLEAVDDPAVRRIVPNAILGRHHTMLNLLGADRFALDRLVPQLV
jgi:hypothetical protein